MAAQRQLVFVARSQTFLVALSCTFSTYPPLPFALPQPTTTTCVCSFVSCNVSRRNDRYPHPTAPRPCARHSPRQCSSTCCHTRGYPPQRHASCRAPHHPAQQPAPCNVHAVLTSTRMCPNPKWYCLTSCNATMLFAIHHRALHQLPMPMPMAVCACRA